MAQRTFASDLLLLQVQRKADVYRILLLHTGDSQVTEMGHRGWVTH